MELPGIVSDYIEKHSLLAPGERVILGVSGGADSCCLLFCLHSLGYELVIGHLDHQLRPESSDEAQFVKDLGRRLNVRTFIGQENVRKLSEEGFSLEEAARIARYRFLVGVAQEVGAQKLATGHTANDQIETVLMHFLRGAGASGLRGMLPSTRLENWTHMGRVEGMRLIRPLLEVKRAQTEAFCSELDLEFVNDPSYDDVTYYRNRIRHELIPYLRLFNPGIEAVILRMSKVMKDHVEFIDTTLKEQWEILVSKEDQSHIRFNREKFKQIPLSLKRSFIRRVIKHLVPISRDLGFMHVEDALDFLENERTSGAWQLPSGLEILLLGDEITIHARGERLHFDELPQLASTEEQKFIPPAEIPLARGWKLRGERSRFEEFEFAKNLSSLEDRIAAIDVKSLSGPLTLRAPIPGDRFSPLGMDGSVKVSDFFINQKIPQPAREYWPLLCDDEGVVWVVGLRIANRVKVSPNTIEIYILKVDPPKEEE